MYWAAVTLRSARIPKVGRTDDIINHVGDKQHPARPERARNVG